jgi:hypothetical protein
MANLVPNLQSFLSEIKKQSQVVESIQEENGSVIIKLRQEVSENSPFTKLVEDLAKSLNLERYVKANYQEVEVDPIQKFLEKMRPLCVGEPQVGDKETVLFLKPEVIKDYPKFAEVRLEARKIGATLIIYPRAGLSIPSNLPKAEKATDLAITAFTVALAALHANRLREFLHRDITKADVAESVRFLLNCGWSEDQLLELGFSHTTLYRFRKYQSGT